MIDKSSEYLLMIEPDQEGYRTSIPVDDEVTRKIKELYELAVPSSYGYRGVHTTRCGRSSDNKDWILPNGVKTHSLCVYYVRYYREHIPESEIEKIDSLHDKLVSQITRLTGKDFALDKGKWKEKMATASLHPSIKEWASAWEIHDEELSPMNNETRKLIRMGHYAGWFGRIQFESSN